jgi:DNA topoisomerase-3
MTRIIISEKPSMGRAIASALGIQGKGRSFIQGGDVIVTWCVGHLVTAMDPEGYDPGLKSWKLDTVPFFPEPFRYAPIDATRINTKSWQNSSRATMFWMS